MSCYHKWKWTEHNFCQECGEFFKNKNHGAPVFQCIKCGVLFTTDGYDGWDYLTNDEIENFRSMGIEVPHIIKIKGV